MKLGIKSNAYFNRNDFVDGLKKLKADGYSFFDYQEFISPDSFLYKLTDDEFSNYLLELKKECDKNEVQVSQVHAVWYAPDNTEELREYNFNHYFYKSILGCKLLKCKNLVVHPIMPFGWGEEDFNIALDINYAFWKRLLPHAKDNGIILCLENMPFKNHALSTPKSIVEFIGKINDDNFQMCFDTGHVNVLGLNIYENIVLAGSKIKTYHIHDNKGADDHCCLYDGNINWADFIRANKEIKFDGVYSLECCVNKDTIPDEVLTEKQKTLIHSLQYIVSKIEN